MIEKIVKYIDKEMTSEEASNFEASLKEDVSLKEEYEATLAAKKIGFVLLQDEILGHLAKYNKINQAPAKRESNPKFISIILSVVALLILAFYAYKYFNKSDIPKQQNNLFVQIHKEPIWPLERGVQNNLQSAIAIYLDEKDSKKATDLLLTGQSTSEESKYWAAEIFIDDKRGKEARNVINELIASEYETERCHYLMVMSYLADNNLHEAKSYISKIGLENFDEEIREKLNLVISQGE
jgi:hypothetical protein